MEQKNKDKPLLSLYLQDEERDADSGFGNELIWTIQLSPSTVTSLASKTSPVSLTRGEIIELASLSKQRVMARLFAKFGMNDLSSRPGYPKGPYFYVEEDVYQEIYRMAKEY